MESTNSSINSFKNDISLKNTFDSSGILNNTEISSPTSKILINDFKNVMKSPDFGKHVSSDKKLINLTNLNNNHITIDKPIDFNNNHIKIDKQDKNNCIIIDKSSDLNNKHIIVDRLNECNK
jgi:hypothetical protein